MARLINNPKKDQETKAQVFSRISLSYYYLLHKQVPKVHNIYPILCVVRIAVPGKRAKFVTHVSDRDEYALIAAIPTLKLEKI